MPSLNDNQTNSTTLPAEREGAVVSGPVPVEVPNANGGLTKSQPAVIPVGHEPERQCHDVHGDVHGGGQGLASRGGPVVAAVSIRPQASPATRRPTVNQSRAKAIRIFTQETMRGLRRSEIAVWLAIHNCEVDGAARISQDRLVELSGTSKRHVGEAVRSLAERGLLEVVFRGRYRPNCSVGHGMASKYRVFASPQSRLLAHGKVGTDRETKRQSGSRSDTQPTGSA
jgi:hypothetical protein